MSLALPKIVYPTGGGTSFTFTYPPRKVPAAVYEAVVHNNVSSAGVRQSVLERVDQFLEFEMEYVKIGTDITAWNSFIYAALQGIAFDYYPDGTMGAYTTYLLEGTNYTAAYKQLGMYSFSLKFRQRVSWP